MKRLDVLAGPMEYEKNSFPNVQRNAPKEFNFVSHRIARETIEIFQDLKDTLRQYEFVICLRKATYKE